MIKVLIYEQIMSFAKKGNTDALYIMIEELEAALQTEDKAITNSEINELLEILSSEINKLKKEQ